MDEKIKTVQLPENVWLLLKELAYKDNRTIASYLRAKITELHQDEFAGNVEKA